MEKKVERRKVNIFEMKKKWMLRNGFCSVPGKGVFEYKGHKWSMDSINKTPIIVIMAYKKFYDNEASKEELDEVINKCKRSSVGREQVS